MGDRVNIQSHGAVAEVCLARPDKLNALDDAMFAALAEAGEKLSAAPGVRAIVLSGEGKAFCAGLDRSLFQTLAGDKGQALLAGSRTSQGANPFQQAMMVWRNAPAPVIAAMQGAAFGGGLQLALAADLRFAAPDAQLSVMEIKWGIIPDLGGVGILRQLVRDDILRDLVFTGRVVSAPEALELGLVTRLADDPRAIALGAAEEIAASSPDAVRAAKALINFGADAPMAAILERESVLQASLIGQPNQIEAVMANLQARPAKFAD